MLIEQELLQEGFAFSFGQDGFTDQRKDQLSENIGFVVGRGGGRSAVAVVIFERQGLEIVVRHGIQVKTPETFTTCCADK